MRVAVTGAVGRLGRALVAALEEAPFTGLSGPIAWTRAEFDLDAPAAIHALLDRDRPEAVVNAAAWTDVDGCAREPDLAHRRNAEAVHVLAEATAARGIDLVQVSTNEVFDGRRTDGQGYGPGDPALPISAYGSSKFAGEVAASAAYRGGSARLGVVRTAWLYGPPGNDFPAKILAAAERARAAGEPLKVVADEFGSPTYTHDLAEAIVELLGSGDVGGSHHIVNGGTASRATWARELFRRAGLEVPIEEVPASTWPRASTPPAWGVLEPTPLPGGEPLRPWQAALADYLPTLLRQRAATGAKG
jgi:dTDP-4-dehydrorhamnose reductase